MPKLVNECLRNEIVGHYQYAYELHGTDLLCEITMQLEMRGIKQGYGNIGNFLREIELVN